MEFACSHIVCNTQIRSTDTLTGQNRSAVAENVEPAGHRRNGPQSRPHSSFHEYDNRFLRVPQGLPSAENVRDARSSNATVHGSDAFALPRTPGFHSDIQSDGAFRPAPPVPPRHRGQTLETSSSSQLSSIPPAQHSTNLSTPPPLPRRSYKSTSPGRQLTANVNVVSINLGKLVDITNVQPSTILPYFCNRCSAAMSIISKTQRHQKDIVWICEFCEQMNLVSRWFSSVPLKTDMTYVSTSDNKDYVNMDDSLIVFCVDISGSMCVTSELESNGWQTPVYVSRLQSVQDAILKSLHLLAQTYPWKRVALVTFNDGVTVYGDGLKTPLTLRDYELMDFDYLTKKGMHFPVPRCITESIYKLSHCVHELREHGATALGPAALVSIAMASRKPGSKVIICTDGLANTGLGYLETTDKDSYRHSQYFYTQLAEQASTQGVIVSVLTFEGTDCKLAEVGRLADRTGGRVNIVSPGNLSTEFQAIVEDNVIATNVTATILIAKDMYFRYEEQSGNKLVKNIGNVTEDKEITFEFGIKDSSVENLQQRGKVPFQLQLKFKTRNRKIATRILTQEKQITANSSMVEDSINILVLGIHAAQLSARLTMEGRVKEAQREVMAQKELIQKVVEKKHNKEEEDIYENWMHNVAAICDNLSTTPEFQNGREASGRSKQENSTVLKSWSDEVANVVYRLKRAKSIMLRKPTREQEPKRGQTM
nr:PREDICTED: circularly permutated Ras protein 1-like isoform X2 [Latimeria chalumnae]|eukprot:XP_005988053.1 PREDICTED: circularly permutated Ras protein 1-like isoform X2 [Latimeria chalumnae]